MPELLDSLREALADRYAVERELGRGGMATVFLAQDLKHHRSVGIKVLHAELTAELGAERFLREIEIAARLQHPHILPLYDSGAAAGFLYYVMPYVEGESLRDRLTREKQLPQEDALRIASEVAGALAYAHSRGVVHRDIKPENIMLSGGTAVVTDFGIARALSAAGDEHHLTQTGTIIGTPAYMSPEQSAGVSEIDGRSDEYSLACVVYEMLVGEPPFTGPTAQAIIARHSLDMVSPPSIVRATIPDAVEGAILRALSKVPADRYPTTALFAEALNTPSAATGAYRRATLERAAVRQRPRAWRRLAPVAVVLVALVGYFVIRPAGAGRGTAVTGLDPRRIAVLYFTDQSSGHTLGYVADGLTEGLIDALRPVGSLTVVSKNGVAPYRSSSAPLDSVARALGVGTIVQGGVDEVSGRYRVSVNLIDGASGADLGKRASFEQPAGAVLAIRDSLASKVAEFLRVRLGEELRLRQEQASTRSVPAWSLVQQGERARKEAEARLATDDVDGAFSGFARADSLLALAERADPSWAEPVTQRGWLAYRRARLAGDRKALVHWVEVAGGHAERALALAPNDARALELRGTVRYLSWLQELAPDPGALPKLLAAAKQDLEAATQTDPSLASGYSTLSHLYYQTEDVPLAVLAARKAYEEDAYLSVAPDVLARLFFGSYDLEQLTQAHRWCLEGERRFSGDFRFAECQLWLMTTADAQPDPSAAWRLLAVIDSLTPAPRKAFEHHRAETIVGVALARARLADSARHVLQRARADRDVDPGQEIVSIEAFARTILGDRDEAIALLQRYIAANPTHAFTRGGDISWWWRDLKSDPRFARLTEAKR